VLCCASSPGLAVPGPNGLKPEKLRNEVPAAPLKVPYKVSDGAPLGARFHAASRPVRLPPWFTPPKSSVNVLPALSLKLPAPLFWRNAACATLFNRSANATVALPVTSARFAFWLRVATVALRLNLPAVAVLRPTVIAAELAAAPAIRKGQDCRLTLANPVAWSQTGIKP